MTMKEAYQKKLQAQFDEWNVEIDKLKAKAEKAEADAKREYNQQIAKLTEQQQEIQTKLAELGEAGEGAWEDLKAGIDNAWDSMSKAVQSAVSRFK